MLIELDKDDLISLIRGMYVSYSSMEHYLIKQYGSYTGGFKDDWNWHINDKTPHHHLVSIYNILKQDKIKD